MQPTRSSPQTSQGPQPYNLFSLPLEWGRMMEAFISGAGSLTPFGSPMGLLSPVRIDVLEDESAFELVAEMPGVQAQDIDVELEGQELRISAQKNGESQHQSDRFHLKERSFGSFSLSAMQPFPAHPRPQSWQGRWRADHPPRSLSRRTQARHRFARGAGHASTGR